MERDLSCRAPGDRSKGTGPSRKRKYLILTVPDPARRPERELAPDRPCDAEETAVRLFSKSRHEMIEEAAYYIAERRGFEPGDPDEDWRQAESEVEALIRGTRPL